jgi:DNA polymerase sigma
MAPQPFPLSCFLLTPAGDGLAADISMGAENGAQAVDFVRRQVLAVPPLRPLCLVIKAFLR